ncbi:glycerophosphodiester phosphodiesterase [Devosia sp.]|uniref:glycerophosphodiester phosphodiesterase n=1 Tax=Devosia sp. TaxID=1871048 RepID=UPI0035AFF6A7
MPSFHFRDNGFVHLCGHRGQSLSQPENTLEAFREGHALGGTSMEIDTVLTADGEIVVMHDMLVDRTTNGSGAVADLALADIRTLDAGAWFGPGYAGIRVPTLAETIALAHELDLLLEIEIKEKRNIGGYLEALAGTLAADDLGRVMMISFDHWSLKQAKARIPGLLTGGIVHERFADPVAVAGMSDLDELCIDLDVFDPADAQALHAAGRSIRCHAYRPSALENARRAGLDWEDQLAGWLRDGLIDTLSGDDIGWLRNYCAAAGVRLAR